MRECSRFSSSRRSRGDAVHVAPASTSSVEVVVGCSRGNRTTRSVVRAKALVYGDRQARPISAPRVAFHLLNQSGAPCSGSLRRERVPTREKSGASF
jgi:hypothetical protein